MSKYSEINIKEVLNCFINKPIIQLIIDGIVIWDEDDEPYIDYDTVITSIDDIDIIIDNINIDIIQFHHLCVSIKTLKDNK